MNTSSNLVDYYRGTHAKRVYGTSSVKYLRFLRPEITLRAPRSVLDYGCGQSLFIDLLGLPEDVALHRYDPAIPEFSILPPAPADLLVSIDVLEHIEEADLDRTLSEMRGCCRDAIIVVDTAASKHMLPDGRNAHVTLRPHQWWEERIARHFGELSKVRTPRRTRAGFKTWVRPKSQFWRFAALRLKEDASHAVRRLFGLHHPHWKVSKTQKG